MDGIGCACAPGTCPDAPQLDGYAGMSRRHEVIIYIVAALVFLSAVVNTLFTTRDHHEFFTDMRVFKTDMQAFQGAVVDFMAPGDRNSAKKGYEACLRLNNVAEQVNCCAIYFPTSPERCLPWGIGDVEAMK